MKSIPPWTIAAGLSLAFGFAAMADTWTNMAGHVVSAQLVAVEGDQVLLRNTNGRTRRVPLSSLKPADRQRVRDQTGTEPLPAELRIPFEQAEEDIHRAAQFLTGGKITPEEYAARCRTIRERFAHFGRQALKERGEESDKAILDRFDRRLHQAEKSFTD